MEAIAAQIAKDKNMPYKTNIEKKAVYKEITSRVAEYLQTMTPTSGTDEILKEMEELRKDNAALRKENASRRSSEQEEDREERKSAQTTS